MIKMVLFDLDGTLLPMDQDVFVKAYFGRLAKKLVPLGYTPDEVVEGIWAGTAAMIQNNGGKTNEQAFWDFYAARNGEEARKEEPVFEAFYQNDFDGVQASCGYHPKAAAIIRMLKEKGFRAALATNPIFPAIATEKRIRWAGLDPADFELITTYENSCYAKPNPAYYLEIMDKLGVMPEECLMVGNDVGEDMIAETLGMKVFLLTDCLINKKETDISVYPHGGFDELEAFLALL